MADMDPKLMDSHSEIHYNFCAVLLHRNIPTF